MKYNSIVFDLDGTLLDTIGDLKDAVNHTLGVYGYEPLSLEQVKHNVGYGIAYLVRESIPVDLTDEELEKALKIYKEYYNAHMTVNTVRFDGINEILSGLKSRGIRVAVNSNKYHTAAIVIMNHYYPGLYDEVLGDGCGFPRKPEPDAVLDYIKRTGGTKETTLYVGDSETDYNTARNAGIDCMIVTWGLRKKEELEKLKSDYMIDCPSDFFKVLDGEEK